MKEANNSDAANARNCPSPEFTPSTTLKYSLEYVQENRVDFLSLLIELQHLILRDNAESDYSKEKIDNMTANLSIFKSIILEA